MAQSRDRRVASQSNYAVKEVEYERQGEVLIARTTIKGVGKRQALMAARIRVSEKIPFRRQEVVNVTKLRSKSRLVNEYYVVISEDLQTW